MELLVQTALSFPLIILVGLLCLVAIYWLLVAVGLAPVEFFEHDSLRDDHLASTMVSLGFRGVPASIALTALLLYGTLIGFALEWLVLRHLSLGIWRAPLGLVMLWAVLAIAAPLSMATCQALKHRCHQSRKTATRALLGETVIVQEAPDESGLCRATLEDDNDVIVTLHGKRRDCCIPDERRVLVKYLASEDAYRSVPQQEYLDAHTRLRKMGLLRKHHGGHAAH
ncbi:hypothetical protein [Modicisalibacter xianhensis]|uniref:Uncharacterized protein n=1 Tax=Modicisalibacter xianhensis TaxID=442341 RepID=A0A1I3B051_9GAMM|nr:hypothetical protein [Halomonas xianhensis]SFH55664.1 hypothetical protein SAMN04487959_105274 [Halomonas xianhensis]